MQSELENVLGCKVDVTTPKGLSTDVTRNGASDLIALALKKSRRGVPAELP